MEITILLFILLLFLSLPGGLLLKLCMEAHDGNAISRFVERQGVRRMHQFLGRSLLMLSLIGIGYNVYQAGLALLSHKMEFFSSGMMMILVFPVVSLWLGGVMQRAGKEGCRGI